MKEPNSLENLSKRDLAEKYGALVASIMRLWGVAHPMRDWAGPLEAVEQMEREARA